MLDRGRDRPDALDQELPEPVPLGAVVQQRVPLLEARVARSRPSPAPVLTRPASPAGSPRRPCRGPCASLLRALVGSRSPKTVPRVWSVSCWRQRASRPSPLNATGSPSRPVPVTTAVGPGALDERAGVGQAALVALVEVAVLALGERHDRVADDPDGVLPALVGAVEARTPRGRRRSGRRPGRPRRRRTSWRPCRRPGVRSSSSYDVDRLVAAMHDVGAPAGDRAGRCRLSGSGPCGAQGLVGHGRNPRERTA